MCTMEFDSLDAFAACTMQVGFWRHFKFVLQKITEFNQFASMNGLQLDDLPQLHVSDLGGPAAAAAAE